MIYKKFYEALGKLLFAIAKADGEIKPKEISTIKDLVRSQLVPIEKSTDEFGTDAAFITEIEFEVFADSNFTFEEAYQSFADFIEEYDQQLSSELKKLAYDLAEKVADAFHGINKKEKSLLNRLQALLKL